MWSQPKWQRVWAAASGTLALAFVGADWLARRNGVGSFMAPSHALLWVSVALGSALGLAGLVAMWLMPRSQREFTAEFARLPFRERLRWRHTRRQLLYSGWLLLLMLGLAVWCLVNGVFMLPAICAANAWMFAALPPWAIPAPAGRTHCRTGRFVEARAAGERGAHFRVSGGLSKSGANGRASRT